MGPGTIAQARPNPTRIMAVSVMSTVSAVFPGFLAGALAVQVSEDLDVSESTYGWAIGSFFGAAMFVSARSGTVAQRIGPKRQAMYALLTASLCQLLIALFVDSFWTLVAALAFAGAANASLQTAINLLISQASVERLGLAIALKQAGMPAASMLSGLAVPVLALTVGWRWAFVLGSILAAVAVGAVRSLPSAVPSTGGEKQVPLQSSVRSLWLVAVGVACLAFAAGSLNAWIVSSGVDVGLSDGVAGAALGVAAGTGVAMRVLIGVRLDRITFPPFRSAAVLSWIGAVGVVALTVRTPSLHLIATLLAFASGWVWPVFTNFGIVRRNMKAAAKASGITQTGVYVGVLSGPVVGGFVIEWSGYPVLWALTAAMMAIGSSIIWWMSPDFSRPEP